MTSFNNRCFRFSEPVENVRFVPFRTVWRFVLVATLTLGICLAVGSHVQALDMKHDGIFVLAFVFIILSVLSDFNYLYSWRVQRGWSFWQLDDDGRITPAKRIWVRASDLIALPPIIRLELTFRRQPFAWRGRIARIELRLPRSPTVDDVGELLRIREQILTKGVADFTPLQPLQHIDLFTERS